MERKPKKSGMYFWKGDSNYGGIDYFDAELGQFLIGDHVPVNAISDENLYWLDEEAKTNENTEEKVDFLLGQLGIKTINP
jgi:hypothetical protein